MYLKSHLGFFPGFPVRHEGSVVIWLPVSDTGPKENDEISLTKEHLRRATFGWNKLQNRFPRALSQIVGDVDAWTQTLPKVLNILSRAIHEGSPLPDCWFDSEIECSRKASEQASRITEKEPRLCRVGRCLELGVLSESRRNAPIAAVAGGQRAADSSFIGQFAWGRGCYGDPQLVESGETPWRATHRLPLAVLGSPGAFSVATHGCQEYLAAWNKLLRQIVSRKASPSLSWPVRPEAHWAAALRKFLAWLQGQPAKECRRALELFDNAYPVDLLPRWNAWWAQFEQVVAAIRRFSAGEATVSGAEPACLG